MLYFLLEIIYPKVPGAAPPQDFLLSAPPETRLSLYIKYFVNLSIWAGGILALFFLIYGGIKYLTSTGKPENLASAKNQIAGAFFGLLILLSSFLILKTINPEFTILELPSLKPIDIKAPPHIEPPKVTAIQTSIDVEIPFSRIIEKLFETYISDYPEPKDPPLPRMLRIKNISRAVIGEDKDMGLADKLKKQSQDLKEAADKCSCRQTAPEEPCGGNKSENTTWKCDLGGCSSTGPCSSDPCAKVRGDIQKTEEENLNVIYKGTEIIQFNKRNKKEKITTSLTKEQIKTEEEIKSLKEWLERLKRAEKLIKECPLRDLNSLAQFYLKSDSFNSQKWTLRQINFWDDINIRYYTSEYTKNIYGSWYFQPTKKIDYDFATFYCAVSGTLEEPSPFPILAPSEQTLDKAETMEEAETVVSESMACSDEAPVGEIIDRAKRVAQLLIDKLETFIKKIKELTTAVDELQVLISQCSSQRGCERRCSSFPCLKECMYKKHGSWRCRPGCKGWAYCCADSSGSYPGECKERDEDTPCPYKEIKEKLEEIEKIWQELKDLVEGKESTGQETPKEKVEKTGIIPLIDEIIPAILEDLENKVRNPMHDCSSGDWQKRDTVLYNSNQVLGAVVPPQNQVLRFSCQTESWDPNQQKMVQTVYGDCFEECYLEIGQDKHRECVRTCLDDKARQTNDPDLAQCFNSLNFYCCNIK